MQMAASSGPREAPRAAISTTSAIPPTVTLPASLLKQNTSSPLTPTSPPPSKRYAETWQPSTPALPLRQMADVVLLITPASSSKGRTGPRVTIAPDTPSSPRDAIAPETPSSPRDAIAPLSPTEGLLRPEAKEIGPTATAPVMPSVVRAQKELQMLIRTLEKPNFKRTVQELSALLAALSNVAFFKSLDESLRLQCCSVLKHLALEANTTVFEEGDKGSLFYVILEGSVGVFIADNSAAIDTKAAHSKNLDGVQGRPSLTGRSTRMAEKCRMAEKFRMAASLLAFPASMASRLRASTASRKSAVIPTPSRREKSMMLAGRFTRFGQKRGSNQTTMGGDAIERAESSTSLMPPMIPGMARLNVADKDLSGKESGADPLKDIDELCPERISDLKAANRARKTTGASAKMTPTSRKRTSVKLRPSELPQKQVAVLSKGAAFGEVALQTNEPRSATIRTKEFTHFVILNRHDYNRMLAEFYSNQQRARVDFLREVSILKKWDQQAVHKLAFLLTIQKFSKREKVYTTGDTISSVYFVLDGQFAVMMPWKKTPHSSDDKPIVKTALSPPKSREKSIAVALLTKPQIFGIHEYIRGSTTYTETVECYSVIGSCYSVVSYKLMSRITAKAREQLVLFYQNEELYHEARNQVLRALDPAKCNISELYTPQGRIDVIKRVASEVLESLPEASQIKCWNVANPNCVLEKSPEEERQARAERKVKKERLIEEFRQCNLSFGKLYFTPSKVGMGFRCNARRIPSLRKFAVGTSANVRKSSPVEIEDEESEGSDVDGIENLPAEPPTLFAPWVLTPPPISSARKLDVESSPSLVNSDIYVPSSARRIHQVQLHPARRTRPSAPLLEPSDVYFSIQAPVIDKDARPHL